MNQISNYIGVQKDGTEVLGKILYYSISAILVERDALAKLCETMGVPCTPSNRSSSVDAFHSATGDIYHRGESQTGGGVQLFKVYCRDNKQADKNIVSRELIKETLGEDTNVYKKLANISYDKENEVFSYDNLSYDSDVDALEHCLKAQELFELYQQCVGRSQIETLLEQYVSSMQASKLLSRGKMFFIPRTEMAKLSLFEDFVDALEKKNRHTGNFRAPLSANSMYVVDDEKQREKMAAAFYATIGKEIEVYQERISALISRGCSSVAVMDRWVLKIQGLEQKRRTYEGVLRRELNEVDGAFETLNYLSQELRLSSSSTPKNTAA